MPFYFFMIEAISVLLRVELDVENWQPMKGFFPNYHMYSVEFGGDQSVSVWGKSRRAQVLKLISQLRPCFFNPFGGGGTTLLNVSLD